MSNPGRYSVKLLNEYIPMISDEGEGHIQELHRIAFEKINQMDNDPSLHISNLTKALYACMFLANDIVKLQRELKAYKSRYGPLSQKGHGEGPSDE